jgi:hypothetical protein
MGSGLDPADPMLDPLRAVGRRLRHLAVGLVALVILFEEWGWEPLRSQDNRTKRFG